MIKFYKGNPIRISKTVNGRGSFKVTFKIYYRYGFFKFKTYEHTVTLSEVLTMKDAYSALKDFIDNLDKLIKI